jgi:hypothetical protein
MCAQEWRRVTIAHGEERTKERKRKEMREDGDYPLRLSTRGAVDSALKVF